LALLGGAERGPCHAPHARADRFHVTLGADALATRLAVRRERRARRLRAAAAHDAHELPAFGPRLRAAPDGGAAAGPVPLAAWPAVPLPARARRRGALRLRVEATRAHPRDDAVGCRHVDRGIAR